MKRFLYEASVRQAEGSQTFYIDAETQEEADARAENDDTDGMYQHECEVVGLSELALIGEADLDDYGDFPPDQPSDTEMLDWMLKNNGLVELRGGQYYCGYGPYGTVLNGALADSPREAIKAAMQADQEGS